MSLATRRYQNLRRAMSGPPASARSATPQPEGGPGTELRKLLHKLGIQPKGKECSCNAHALQMDRRGAAWCEQQMDTIVDWLAEEAKKRPIVGLLFSRTLARQMVRLAIARARAAAR
jgi:hypothetical protein